MSNGFLKEAAGTFGAAFAILGLFYVTQVGFELSERLRAASFALLLFAGILAPLLWVTVNKRRRS
ncbi:hypothetical protein ACFO3H_14730 [Halorussus sp. GCM10023401]